MHEAAAAAGSEKDPGAPPSLGEPPPGPAPAPGAPRAAPRCPALRALAEPLRRGSAGDPGRESSRLLRVLPFPSTKSLRGSRTPRAASSRGDASSEPAPLGAAPPARRWEGGPGAGHLRVPPPRWWGARSPSAGAVRFAEAAPSHPVLRGDSSSFWGWSFIPPRSAETAGDTGRAIAAEQGASRVSTE